MPLFMSMYSLSSSLVHGCRHALSGSSRLEHTQYTWPESVYLTWISLPGLNSSVFPAVFSLNVRIESALLYDTDGRIDHYKNVLWCLSARRDYKCIADTRASCVVYVGLPPTCAHSCTVHQTTALPASCLEWCCRYKSTCEQVISTSEIYVSHNIPRGSRPMIN